MEKLRLESDLEGAKHVGYHLCAVADDLKKSFTEDALGSLTMCASSLLRLVHVCCCCRSRCCPCAALPHCALHSFFTLNEVFTKKLKPQLGARWQDKEEGYQNVFAAPDDDGALPSLPFPDTQRFPILEDLLLR